MATTTPPVAIIMGSRSDWPTMKHAADALDRLGVAWDAQVVSAHRTPERLFDFATGAKAAGFKVIIAGAGGAAHLPGMAASMTALPVLGVPVQSKALKGLDSLLSIVQMPGGVPVATLAIGEAGAKNAGILAAQILALSDDALADRLAAFREAQTDAVARDGRRLTLSDIPAPSRPARPSASSAAASWAGCCPRPPRASASTSSSSTPRRTAPPVASRAARSSPPMTTRRP